MSFLKRTNRPADPARTAGRRPPECLPICGGPGQRVARLVGRAGVPDHDRQDRRHQPPGRRLNVETIPPGDQPIWFCPPGMAANDEWIEVKLIGCKKRLFGAREARIAFRKVFPYEIFKAVVYGPDIVQDRHRADLGARRRRRTGLVVTDRIGWDVVVPGDPVVTHDRCRKPWLTPGTRTEPVAPRSSLGQASAGDSIRRATLTGVYAFLAMLT